MKRAITLFMACLCAGFIAHVKAQGTNLALTATATHSGGGASPNYGPELYNNNIIPPYGVTGTLLWGWVSTGGWIEFTWSSPQTVAKVKLHKQNRPLTNCTLEYWNGSSYVPIMTYSSTTAPQLDSLVFTPVATTKLRMNNCITTTSSGNPNHGEIQVFGPEFPNNLSATTMLQPLNNSQHCYGAGVPLKVKVWNAGSAAQSNFSVAAHYSGPGGSATVSAIYPGTLNAGAIDSIVVGTITPQPGTYTVTGFTQLTNDQHGSDDSTAFFNFTVNQPVNPPATISDTVCMGMNAFVYVDAQLGGTYKWYSASAGGTLVNIGNVVNFPSLTQDTTMYISATINNCESGRTPINAVVGPAPVVDLGPDTSFCESIPLLLNAGNPGGEYTWSTGDSTQSITITNVSGTYWVTVDRYCQVSDSVNVTIAPMPKVTGISYVRSHNVYHFSPSGAQNVDTYLWIFGDGTTSSLPDPVHTFDPNINVALTVLLIVGNNCGTDTVIRAVPTAINGLEGLEAEVNIFPNPAQNFVFIQSDKADIEEVQVINMLGNIVSRRLTKGENRVSFDISSLAAGNYIVRIHTAAGDLGKPLQIIR
jgi:hypothetical protein